LTIRGYTWRLYHSKSRPRWVEKGVVGLCFRDPAERRIWVHDSGNIEEDASTLIHEALHAVFPDAIMLPAGESIEEAVVNALERGVAALVRDNDLAFCRVRRSAK
jgi:hypothetical protein